MTRRFIMAAVTLASVATGLVIPVGVAHGASRCSLPWYGPGRSYHPVIEPSRFTSVVTNAWFPLPVGQTWIYAGTKDGKHAIDVVQVSKTTTVVDGVRTRAVNDRLLLDGVLTERTTDYYAQDDCGNVWYFGEDTAELDTHGRVKNTGGSFHAGVDGAQPGVFMQDQPEVGHRFRQEWFKGQAEDAYVALSTTARRTVPYGEFRSHVLLTKEWTALEPGVTDHKYYVRGIGEIEELAVRGPTERLRLVAVLR